MNYIVISAVLGFLSVLIGAFGAHIAVQTLTESLYKTLQVAIDYHQFYSLFLLVLSLFNRQSNAGFVIPGYVFKSAIVGVLLFSGSLYAYVLTGVKALTFVTPVGGMILMLMWGLLGVAAFRYYRAG
tara:strand:+ start:4066 stop:4446 length:381 start_codon:yes stop_codon:yes gene_type:complete